jgi:hypothetical protein
MNTGRILEVERPYVRLGGFRALRLYVRARRNGQLLLAAAVALGILFMMIHWG